MLLIRREQMEVFEKVARRPFEDEMVLHSQEFSPKLCKVIGEKQLRIALDQAIDKAKTYNFTYRGPVRLYIELMFLLGSHFDTDPQYVKFNKLLNATGNQMQRAEHIHREINDYIQVVSGENNINVRKALEALWIFAKKPITFGLNDFVEGMCKEMTLIFPQKTAYIGKDSLVKLIHEGQSEAQKYDFLGIRANSLIVVLMFAFGHGCINDPLYPWISKTIKNKSIIDPVDKTKLLEKKSLIWLDKVLSRHKKV